jgi:hypothetical protein
VFSDIYYPVVSSILKESLVEGKKAFDGFFRRMGKEKKEQLI